MFDKYRDFFDYCIDDLPIDLIQDVHEDFAPIGWEQLSPEQRQSFAKQMVQIETEAFELLFDLEVTRGELQDELIRVKQMVSTSPSATRDKRSEIADLKRELADLEQRMDLYSKDHTLGQLEKKYSLSPQDILIQGRNVGIEFSIDLNLNKIKLCNLPARSSDKEYSFWGYDGRYQLPLHEVNGEINDSDLGFLVRAVIPKQSFVKLLDKNGNEVTPDYLGQVFYPLERGCLATKGIRDIFITGEALAKLNVVPMATANNSKVDEKPSLTPQQYIQSLMDAGTDESVIVAKVSAKYPHPAITNKQIGCALGWNKGLEHGSIQNKVMKARKKGIEKLKIKYK